MFRRPTKSTRADTLFPYTTRCRSVYGQANGTTSADTIEAALDYQRQGYKAIRWQCGVPGMASTYGVSKDRYFYEPADNDLPTENIWSTAKYMRVVPAIGRAHV